MKWLIFLGFLWHASAAFPGTAWPQFRGPDGQGHADAKRLPLEWSETRNVSWKTPIPGQGWSSPVVENGRIWMTTATEEGKSLRVVGVDLKSGRILHNFELFHVDNPRFKHALNSFASPSPVVEGDRVYCNFGTHGTACVDARTGSVLWKSRELQLEHENGPGSSPALYHGKLIIPCDGTNVQYIAALNARDGTVAWKVNRSVSLEHRADQMRKAYSTPLVIDAAGKTQVVIPGAEYVYAYEPDTGKELWRVHYPGFSNVPRPVYAHGLVYVATGFGKPEIWAIRPDGSGEVTDTHVVWKYSKQAPAKPSPVVVGGRFYMVSDGGIATCLDAKTGHQVWQERVPGEYSASPLAAAGRIYLFSMDGPATVLSDGADFKVEATNKLEEGFMASPAVIDDALILRTKNALYRIEEKK